MATEREIKLNRFDYGINEQERDLPNGYYSYLENVELKKGAKQVANNVVQISGTEYVAGADRAQLYAIIKQKPEFDGATDV